jgi:hypothetical protein
MDVNRRRAAGSIVGACVGVCASFVYLEACTEGVPASPTLAADYSGLDASADGAPYVCPGAEASYPACPSTPPSWQGEVKQIVYQYCGPCHLDGGTGISKGGDYNYTTLAGFTGLATILTDVHACTMPPQGSPPLPPTDWETLLQWLECDAPDN